MTRDQALQKIKKCLALAKSTNPHEAAAGLRQAQKLMAEFGVNDDDVALSAVRTTTCTTRTNSQPRWEVLLAATISSAFGCETMWTRSGKWVTWADAGGRMVHKCEVVFIGVGSAAQIAGYAWDVLSRQCAKARLAHIRKQPARCKPITLTARGDEFAMGWVVGVSAKLDAFVGSECNVRLIEQYKATTWPDAEVLKPKDRAVGRNVSLNDRHDGFIAGRNAQLERGVDGMSEQRLLA